MPADYCVPATAILPPEKSAQYAFGLAHTSRNGMFEITIEPFYKTMSNLIAFEEGIAYLGGSGNWQYKVDGGGKGKSYGIIILLLSFPSISSIIRACPSLQIVALSRRVILMDGTGVKLVLPLSLVKSP